LTYLSILLRQDSLCRYVLLQYGFNSIPFQTTIILPKLTKKARGKRKVAGRRAGALFVGGRGPLTAQGLQQIWKLAVKEAGLPKELSIHSARHTLAVHLLKKTSNLRQVQKQLGHSSPATTANMYADISFADMQEGLNGLYDCAAQTAS